MERRNERIEALLERYFEAQTTAAEERELREFFTCGQEIPRELQYARTMFCGLEALAGEKVRVWDELVAMNPESAKSQAPVILQRETLSADGSEPVRRRGLLVKIWAGAAAAAVTAVGLFALVSYLNRPYCYINGVPVRDAETAMQATIYFEQLEVLDKPMESLDGMMKQIQKEKI